MENENDPIQKAIAKYQNHPSIISIKKITKNLNSSFSFQHVLKDKITKIINLADPTKIVQLTDIPTKLIKSFSGFFSDNIILILISTSKTEHTLKTLKKRKCFPCTKKMVDKKKVTTDQSVFFQMFQSLRKINI